MTATVKTDLVESLATAAAGLIVAVNRANLSPAVFAELSPWYKVEFNLEGREALRLAVEVSERDSALVLPERPPDNPPWADPALALAMVTRQHLLSARTANELRDAVWEMKLRLRLVSGLPADPDALAGIVRRTLTWVESGLRILFGGGAGGDRFDLPGHLQPIPPAVLHAWAAEADGLLAAVRKLRLRKREPPVLPERVRRVWVQAAAAQAEKPTLKTDGLMHRHLARELDLELPLSTFRRYMAIARRALGCPRRQKLE